MNGILRNHNVMNGIIRNRYVTTKKTPIRLLIARYDPDRHMTSSELLHYDHWWLYHYPIVTLSLRNRRKRTRMTPESTLWRISTYDVTKMLSNDYTMVTWWLNHYQIVTWSKEMGPNSLQQHVIRYFDTWRHRNYYVLIQ